MFELLKNLDLRVYICPTPIFYHGRWGFEWNRKTRSKCPFGRYEKNRWCKTGFRLYYGSKKKHIVVRWDDSLFWCPIEKDACLS